MTSSGTTSGDYYERVYRIVESIPYGRVTTYGAIAGHLGVRSGARMVGYALNNSIQSGHTIPAHRVVNRLGELTGRGWFPGDTMRERLQQEGVAFIDDFRVDMEAHFWDPSNPEDFSTV
ncbi:MAG: MGMT family protein [Balneolaceae bacterium]